MLFEFGFGLGPIGVFPIGIETLIGIKSHVRIQIGNCPIEAFYRSPFVIIVDFETRKKITLFEKSNQSRGKGLVVFVYLLLRKIKFLFIQPFQKTGDKLPGSSLSIGTLLKWACSKA